MSAKRSSGRLAAARASRRSMASGKSGSTSRAEGKGVDRWAIMMPIQLPDMNGGAPVSIW